MTTVKVTSAIGYDTLNRMSSYTERISERSSAVVQDFAHASGVTWTNVNGTWASSAGGISSTVSSMSNALTVSGLSISSGIIDCAIVTAQGAGKANGSIIFGYIDEDNYRYATMDESGDKWVIGEVINGVHYDRAVLAQDIVTNGAVQYLKVKIGDYGIVSRYAND